MGWGNTVLENMKPAAVGRGKGGDQMVAADTTAPASSMVVAVVVAVWDGERGRD